MKYCILIFVYLFKTLVNQPLGRISNFDWLLVALQRFRKRAENEKNTVCLVQKQLHVYCEPFKKGYVETYTEDTTSVTQPTHHSDLQELVGPCTALGSTIS